jgi:hypothetical protein
LNLRVLGGTHFFNITNCNVYGGATTAVTRGVLQLEILLHTMFTDSPRCSHSYVPEDCAEKAARHEGNDVPTQASQKIILTGEGTGVSYGCRRVGCPDVN